jgi:hypothetical protein
MSSETTSTLDEAIAQLRRKATPQTMEQIQRVYGFTFSDTGASYTLDLRSPGGGGWLAGSPEQHRLTADFAVSLSSADFVRLVFGQLHPMAGMATGRMRLSGNFREALKLDRLMRA